MRRITNDGNIIISSDGKDNTGMRVDTGSIDLGDANKSPKAVNNGTIEINGLNVNNLLGYSNFGMVANGINEGLDLAAAKEYVNQHFDEAMLSVVYGGVDFEEE